MPDQVAEYRLVIQYPLGPRDSRVMEDIVPLHCAGDAAALARYWCGNRRRGLGEITVETRTVSRWEELRAS